MNTIHRHPRTRLAAAALMVLAAPCAWAQSTAARAPSPSAVATTTATVGINAATGVPATNTAAAALARVQLGVQVGSLVGLQTNLQTGLQIGLGAAVNPNGIVAPADLVARIQASTGRPLSPAAQRYLADRMPDAQPGDAAACRDLDRTFDVDHRSYGSLSPRARRQLNDCTPTLVPVTSAF